MVGGERQTLSGRAAAANFLLQFSAKREKVKLRFLNRAVGKSKGPQRDKRGFERGLSDRHFVCIQSRKMTP